jgi:hypothetical protein
VPAECVDPATRSTQEELQTTDCSPSSAFLDDAVWASKEQASHGTAGGRPMAVEKAAPRAQGLPGSLGWLTAGEVAERSGVVSCKPTAERVCGVRLKGNGAIARLIGCRAERGNRAAHLPCRANTVMECERLGMLGCPPAPPPRAGYPLGQRGGRQRARRRRYRSRRV